MVIKGGARSGAASLAAHLQRVDTNERAELRQLRGVAAKDLDGALREMEAVSLGSRSRRHFYHASINTRADEVMTPDQWNKAVDRLENELQLTDQPRAVMFHLKEGRAHVHVVWSRIDLDSMTAISDSHNYRRHELVSRELEREFGHARVQGAHVERDGEPRPDRTPSRSDIQRAERDGFSPAEAKATLTDIWNRTDSAQAFVAAIQEQGWLLARGDRRDFVLLDPAGEVHSLARRIDGARAADVRARMSEIEPGSLPSVEEARAAIRARVEERLHTDALVAGDQSLTGVSAIRPIQEAAKMVRTPEQPGGTHVADDEERRRTQENTTAKGGMVAQQQEAQKRFERSWVEVRARRQAVSASPGGVADQEEKRMREEQAAQDRARQGDDRSR